MLIMASIIRVGQSKFVTVQIDEDSQERILNCIQTLSELEEKSAVHDIFLHDTKAAYSKMLVAQEVCLFIYRRVVVIAEQGTRRNAQRTRKLQRVIRRRSCRLMICCRSASSRKKRMRMLSMYVGVGLT